MTTEVKTLVFLNQFIGAIMSAAGAIYLILFVQTSNLPCPIFDDEFFQAFCLPAFFSMTLFAAILTMAALTVDDFVTHEVRDLFLFMSALISSMIFWMILVCGWLVYLKCAAITERDLYVLSPFLAYFAYMTGQFFYINSPEITAMFTSRPAPPPPPVDPDNLSAMDYWALR